METLEVFGVAVGLLYLYLEYRASAWLWVASIAMPAIYLDVYYEAGLYADFGISIYYILASIYGLVCWLRGSDEAGKPLTISRTPGSLWLPLGLGFAAIVAAIGFLLSRFTDSTVPWADAMTTALSIVAMWMLARKYVEQWLVWIAVDVASAALYAYKDLWFTGTLYLAYAAVAFVGYRKWKQLMTN